MKKKNRSNIKLSGVFEETRKIPECSERSYKLLVLYYCLAIYYKYSYTFDYFEILKYPSTRTCLLV